MGFYQFKEFMAQVKEEILYYLPELSKAKVYVKKVVKNNGITLHALHILEDGKNCSPSVYLEGYYEEYADGTELEAILEKIAQFYREHVDGLSLEIDEITSFEQMRNRIIMRLVNKEKNEELLENCPHIHWNDLAITFRWLAHSDEVGIATALITNREMQLWNQTKEELFAIAKENTPQLFPMRCDKLQDMVLEYMTSEEEREAFLKEMEISEDMNNIVKMYVLSNEQRINGATSVLYEEVLKEFAEKIRSNFYLLPSSIHEMILIPETKNIDRKDLKSMVLEANLSVVSEGELLSNHIYYYDRKENIVCMY